MARQGDQSAPLPGERGPNSVSPCSPVTRRVKEALIHVWGKINCYFIIPINWYTAICFHYSTHITGKIIPSFSTSLHCCFRDCYCGSFLGAFVYIVKPLFFWTWLLDLVPLTEPAPKVSVDICSMSSSLLTEHAAQRTASLSFWVRLV